MLIVFVISCCGVDGMLIVLVVREEIAVHLRKHEIEEASESPYNYIKEAQVKSQQVDNSMPLTSSAVSIIVCAKR